MTTLSPAPRPGRNAPARFSTGFQARGEPNSGSNTAYRYWRIYPRGLDRPGCCVFSPNSAVPVLSSLSLSASGYQLLEAPTAVC